jgi:tetratricopeptide (TPR) repeat protein/predicted aspartyl protease
MPDACADNLLHLIAAVGRLAVLSLTILSFNCFAQDSANTSATTPDADQLYISGKFAEAQAAYEALLKQSSSDRAQAGLIRSLLRQSKVDQAVETATKALTAQPSSPVLLSALGDVQFRTGQFAQAQTSYINSSKADPNDIHNYLGLADIYNAASLYRHAYNEVLRAYQIDPKSPEVTRARMGYLPRKARLALLESYLAGPHPDDADATRGMQRYLDFLKETAGKPPHACKLVTKPEQTQMKLEMMLRDPTTMQGVGLVVSLNGHNSRLLLDTGAGGITVSKRVAEKAGLVRIAEQHFRGIGDQGGQSGYSAIADHIQIGDLEFSDCIVSVSDKPMASQDGLIGTDVFSRYVVDLDMYGLSMKLLPLPRRPEDIAKGNLADPDEGDESATVNGSTAKTENSASNQNTEKPEKPFRPPQDRYIAPEMANWVQVYRFGHMLLAPTFINDEKQMRLFLVDTGAFTNTMSTRLARSFTRVSSDDRFGIRGVSGGVSKVYSANSLTLQFGHFRQKNQEAVTLDLSSQSNDIGTEMSGILGFTTLRMLELKIDYRDGLVDFIYDPGKFPGNSRSR